MFRLLMNVLSIVSLIVLSSICANAQLKPKQTESKRGIAHTSVDGVLGFKLGAATNAEALSLHCSPETERITYNLEPDVIAHTFEVINWQGDLDLDLSAPTVCTSFSDNGIVVAFRMDIDFRHNPPESREAFKTHFKSRLGWDPATTSSSKFFALQWTDEDSGICQYYELTNGTNVICWAWGGKATDRLKYISVLKYDNGMLSKNDSFVNAPIIGFDGFVIGAPIESAVNSVNPDYEYVGKKTDSGGRFEALCFHSIGSPISTIKVDPTQGMFIFVLVGGGKIHEVSLVFIHGTYKSRDLDDTLILYEEKYGKSMKNQQGYVSWVDYWNAAKIEFKKSEKFNWIEYSDLTWMDVSVIELFQTSSFTIPNSKDKI